MTEKLQDFYNDSQNKHLILPKESKINGHINVFPRWHCSAVSTFVRRDYYRIALLIGSGIFRYADQIVEVDGITLFVGNKTIPYSWVPVSTEQKGWVCVFSEHFLRFGNQNIQVENFPIFNFKEPPIFLLNEAQGNEFSIILENMQNEMNSEYVYKYSLLQSCLITLIHKIQKLEKDNFGERQTINASHRAAYRFLELLEQQFPIESPDMPLKLKKPSDYAQKLNMHPNSLNHSIKLVTGKPVSTLIINRVIEEAKSLLLNSDWTITEIANALGFEHPSHFTNYFRKQMAQTPREFRLSNTII